MELKIDDKDFCRELADMAVNDLRRYIENGESTMFYDNQVSCIVKEKVDEIIKQNEEKILKLVVDVLAEKYFKSIKMLTVLSALSDKGGK